LKSNKRALFEQVKAVQQINTNNTILKKVEEPHCSARVYFSSLVPFVYDGSNQQPYQQTDGCFFSQQCNQQTDAQSHNKCKTRCSPRFILIH
jgi:hypothetical protein